MGIESINEEAVKTAMENISEAALVDFAREKPLGDPEVRDMLIQWMLETEAPESPDTPSSEFVQVAIEHSLMKYRLGFISKEEALEELAESGDALASEGESTKDLSGVMDKIEDGVFEIIKKED